MKPLAAILPAAFWAMPVVAEPVEVPSGQAVEFVEVIRDIRGPEGLTWRFRFVAPGISQEDGQIEFEQASADMDFLCNDFAIPRLPAMGPRPQQVIISLSAEAIEFGEANPEITQFFEAYSIKGDTCEWAGI